MAIEDTPTTAPTPEVLVSSPIESPQFCVHIYRDSHGTTRTVQSREHVGLPWGPEYLLLSEPAAEVSA